MPAPRAEPRSRPDAPTSRRASPARRALALALLAALFVAASGTAQPGPPGAGLDLVLLVDRSASMSGPGRLAPSDPHGLRDLLLGVTLELVARSAEANRVSHRLGVVSFGSVPRIDLPLYEVRPRDLGPVGRELPAGPSGSLGHTNFLAAFVAAGKLFRALPANPERRRAVVLITDGIPCVPGLDPADQGRKLRAFVATNFSGPETAVEVVILPPPGKGRSFDRPLWRDLSRG